MTMPDSIGAALAALAKVRRQREALEARLEPIAAAEKNLREHLLNAFKKSDLNGAKGSGLSLAVVQLTSPKVSDWEAFFKFARRPGNDDLLNRAVNSAAWRERSESGKAVPGVEVFHNVTLRVTQQKRGEKA